MPQHQTCFRVRYAETDQMGIVHHANYLVWMEIGRVELVRSLGINYRDIEAIEGIYLSVISASCRYIAPAKYDQEVCVSSEVAAANSRMLEFTYTITLAGSEKPLAEGSTRHIWLNRDLRPTRLPHAYLERLVPTPVAH